MNATFTICMDFAQIGPMIYSLALSHYNKRKFVLTTVVTVACWAMVLVVFAASRSSVLHFDKQNALLPSMLRICNALFFPVVLVVYVIPQMFNISPRVHRHSPRVLCVIFVIFMLCVVLSTLQCVGFSLYFCGDDNCENNDDENNERLPTKGRWLPQTPYSIGDIDQAVALSIGIVTLLLSIHDMIQDYNFSIDDEFEYWRIRCVRSIECGDTSVEVVRWKQALEAIDKISKCERTRARHRIREHETFENLPKDVKRALKEFILSRELKRSGIL